MITETQREYNRLKNKKYNDIRKERARILAENPDAEVEMRTEKSNDLREFQRIRNIICMDQGVTIQQLESKAKNREFVIARHLICYFTEPFCTLKFIGQQLGKRDHSTSLHGKNSIEDGMQSNQAFSLFVERIRGLIYAPIVVDMNPQNEMQEDFETFKMSQKEM
jgi:chromosomal replication initiation ATPase DnaA